jgi:hypothetical protein
MDMVEPFVALVVYPTTPGAQSRQAAIRLAADLHPVAHWLRQHAIVEAP